MMTVLSETLGYLLYYDTDLVDERTGWWIINLLFVGLGLNEHLTQRLYTGINAFF